MWDENSKNNSSGRAAVISLKHPSVSWCGRENRHRNGSRNRNRRSYQRFSVIIKMQHTLWIHADPQTHTYTHMEICIICNFRRFAGTYVHVCMYVWLCVRETPHSHTPSAIIRLEQSYAALAAPILYLPFVYCASISSKLTPTRALRFNTAAELYRIFQYHFFLRLFPLSTRYCYTGGEAAAVPHTYTYTHTYACEHMHMSWWASRSVGHGAGERLETWVEVFFWIFLLFHFISFYFTYM